MRPWVPYAGMAGLLAAGGAVVYLYRKQVVGYFQGEPFPLTVQAIALGKYLSPIAAQAFESMEAAAQSNGVSLVVDSAFRTMEQQQRLYAQYVAYTQGTGPYAPLAAVPGHSNHQTGVAVDIDTSGGANAAFRWLSANAFNFGFKRTVASEPWHWEYV